MIISEGVSIAVRVSRDHHTFVGVTVAIVVLAVAHFTGAGVGPGIAVIAIVADMLVASTIEV